MKVISASSVDEGLHNVLKELHTEGNSISTDSRNGPVLRFNSPATIMWQNPMRRVSFDGVRDANPVFHLFEAFWMLAGANDVKRPSYFAANLKTYSDDGETMAGAYGHRWRFHFGYDQIDEFIIPNLRANKEDRRCVLQMWDPVADYQNGKKGGKDLCCNLSVEFDAAQGRLDMMVTNRSNDIVWGATGANVVHFAFLQEYIAGALGIPVGVYSQVAMNSHIYTENEVTKRVLTKFKDDLIVSVHDERERFPYFGATVPLFDPKIDPQLKKQVIDSDIKKLMKVYEQTEFRGVFESRFFKNVVAPCVRAFNLYKADKLEQALTELNDESITGSDWMFATYNWIERRVDMRNAKIKQLAVESGSTVSEEVWRKTLISVWPSATPRELKTDVGTMLAYEAEVWDGKQVVLDNVGTWIDGRVTIRARGND